jgi:hypothetical protein
LPAVFCLYRFRAAKKISKLTETFFSPRGIGSCEPS